MKSRTGLALIVVALLSPLFVDAKPQPVQPSLPIAGEYVPQFDEADNDSGQEVQVVADRCTLDANGNWRCPAQTKQAATRQPVGVRTAAPSSRRLFSRVRSRRGCGLLGRRCR